MKPTKQIEKRKYKPGEAIRTQMLKEAGLTWEQYQKALVSVEEFISLLSQETSKAERRMVEKIEGMKIEEKRDVYSQPHSHGYNQAIDDIINQLKEKK